MSDEFPAPPEAPAPPPAPPQMPPQPAAPDDSTGRVLAALGYVFWVIALIALLIDPYKNVRFVRFHAVQALGLGIAVWAIGAALPIVGWIAAIAGFIYQIYLAVKAWNGEMVEVPVVYNLVKSFIDQ